MIVQVDSIRPLVWESYLTDEDALHDIHRVVAKAAFDRWLRPPLKGLLRSLLTQPALVPILCGIPIGYPWPTNPRELPMPVAEWTALLQSERPHAIKARDLPLLELERTAFLPRPVD